MAAVHAESGLQQWSWRLEIAMNGSGSMPAPERQDARLSAVDDVEIQAVPAACSELMWFYGELIGLPQVGSSGDQPDQQTLHFKSDRLRLRIQLLPDPVIEAVAHRLHCAVSALEEVAQILDQKKYPYQRLRGMQFTDQALSLLDPAGNRVMLRQMWDR